MTFNNATLLFSKRKFKDVLELLQKVQYEEIFYALGSKAMILSSYFELDEVNALNSFIDSFKLYLQRNKEISKLQKSYYLSLIYFTKQLLIANKTKKQLLLLKTELSNSSPVGKEWLLEKIDEQIAVAKPDPVEKKKKS
ncbi:MAG: hypothetical protein HOP11_00005 [Saprospiraceae bacterium]|nr:hypothetical protein [Saprospiraceae bacterium]